MENYGIDMKGNIQIENVSTLPAWTSSDERRMIYVAYDDRIYYGSGSKWERVLDNSYYISEHNKGWYKRPLFKWISDTTIDIYPGAYHYNDGTTEKMVYWNDKLTFVLGPGGSNVNSDSLSTDQWHYIYLHKTSIDSHGSVELDEGCFINSASASPSILTTGGYGIYYDTSRLIYALRTDGSSNIAEFFQYGNFTQWANFLTRVSSQTLGSSWTNIGMSVPTITGVNIRSSITIHDSYSDSTADLFWRTKYQTGSTGTYILSIDSTSAYKNSNIDVISDYLNGYIEMRHVGGVLNNITVHQNGWYLPDGI